MPWRCGWCALSPQLKQWWWLVTVFLQLDMCLGVFFPGSLEMFVEFTVIICFFVSDYDVIAIFKLRMLSFGWKEVLCCCSCLAASTWATPHNTELIAMEGVRDAFEQTVGNSIRCSQLQMRAQVFQTREARKLFQQKFNTWASQHSQKPACNLDISF